MQLLAAVLFMGLVITTLHLEVPLLLSIHIELIFFLLVVGQTAYGVFLQEKQKLSFSHPIVLPLLLVSLYALAPLLSSFFSDQLWILQDGEYKSLVKILLLAPCLYYLLIRPKNRDLLLNAIIFFYCVLGVYFLYRYFVLGEAREYDGRPLLSIRHGDPNFLCTFFAMMVPLALMQAWRAVIDKKNFQVFLHLVAALFLVICAFVTQSRMGILALLVGLGFLLTRRFSNSPKVAAVKVAAAVCFLAMVSAIALEGSLAHRFSDINDKSSADRLLTYENGFKVFAENPFFGSGMHKARDFFFANSKYPHFQSEFKPLEVHNTYLNVLAELGVVGFVAFAAILIWAWLAVWRSQNPERYFLITSYFILAAASLTVGISYKDLVLLHLFVLAALAQQKKDRAL
ncbi:O-antigen ligase family protein [Bdellovibrio sp. HCB290]|uniref:O-antigen ligase family protein n=1 Tax=Bdellovibrio sp. HCB290 TaxID=3394356 RepID=UPI0039B59CD0